MENIFRHKTSRKKIKITIFLGTKYVVVDVASCTLSQLTILEFLCSYFAICLQPGTVNVKDWRFLLYQMYVYKILTQNYLFS